MVDFLRMHPTDRAAGLRVAETALGKSCAIVEKDVWLVWTLDTLFRMPGAHATMAFKGGTSLSKVFGAIRRFSEDVDITLDYRRLEPSIRDIDLATLSRSQRKRLSESLTKKVLAFSKEQIIPYLEVSLRDLSPDGNAFVEPEEDGEKIRIRYVSAVPETQGESNRYLDSSILIELGGRNHTEPSKMMPIATEIGEVLPDMQWPIARVNVLSPKRTYWEKATLIHVEVCLEKERKMDRLSRHWYDLSQLADQTIGIEAISDYELLQRVVAHKSAFYSYSAIDYEDCLKGDLRLMPGDKLREAMRQDFEEMIGNGMFYGEQPNFDAVLERIDALETEINNVVREHRKQHGIA